MSLGKHMLAQAVFAVAIACGVTAASSAVNVSVDMRMVSAKTQLAGTNFQTPLQEKTHNAAPLIREARRRNCRRACRAMRRLGRAVAVGFGGKAAAIGVKCKKNPQRGQAYLTSIKNGKYIKQPKN